jgi:hypothetical protein
MNISAWNSNYSIASVHLVGAAVDNEEVSKIRGTLISMEPIGIHKI